MAAADYGDQVMTEIGVNNDNIANNDVEMQNDENLFERLTVRNENRAKWGKRTSNILLHPNFPQHLNHLKDVNITKKFFGEKLQNDWIKETLKKGVGYNLKSLRIMTSGITSDEFAVICEKSEIENVYIHKCYASTKLQISEIARFLKKATKIWIDIKGITFERDWLQHFIVRGNNDGIETKIETFTIHNIPIQRIEPHLLEEFLMTVASTTENVVTLSFKEKIKVKQVNNLMNTVFKRVPKQEFNHFNSTQKFVVHFPGTKNYKNYYYVSAAAINGIQDDLAADLESLHT
uniref:Uncharacterized protein n=1 Tax=Panagrolaimus davidi TaxID=227884 RepID=A0A914P1V2_9BILA